MSAHHVMILGCGRSGTSIFGELFDLFPGYTYLSEPPYAALPGTAGTPFLAVKVPRESPGFTPSPGLSFPLEDAQRRLPKPLRFFWQVRHPLDTVASLRVGIAKDWGHHPRPPDWRDWLARPLVERCAHHWAYLNTVGYAQVASLALVMRFEEMIRDPAGFAASVCSAVGLDPAAHEAVLAPWVRRVQDRNTADFVEARTSRSYSRPDHSVRVGRWKENLTAEDVERVRPLVAEAAARFGYVL